MSELTSADIYEIAHQSDVVSYPLRKNFAAMKAAINDNQNQISAISSAGSANETVQARLYHSSLNDRLTTAEKASGNMLIAGGEVIEQSTPNMTVKIKALEAIVNGVAIKRGYGSWARSGTTVTITEYTHGFTAGVSNIYIDVSSATTPLPLGEYTVQTTPTVDTFTIIGVSSGATSGTCEYSRYSGTVTAPTTALDRYDIVVLNSDSTISIVTGSESGDPIYPAIASTQRPLAILTTSSATTSLNDDTEIRECSQQGCIVDNRWYWLIQDAIDTLNDRASSEDKGEVLIRKGRYFEEVDLSGLSNITLRFENGAVMYRISDTNYCIKSINTGGSETIGIRIIASDLRGNTKAGSCELLKFEYTDEFEIRNCRFDGNNSSTATNKNWLINQCDNFFLYQNLNLDNSGDIDYAETDITTCTKYMEDGYYTGQVTFCGTTGQKAQMVKQGWIELTAMDDRILMCDKDTATTSDGAIARDGTHSHKWIDDTGNGSSYDQDGVVVLVDNETCPTGEGAAVVKPDQNKWTAKVESFPQYYTLIALIHR